MLRRLRMTPGTGDKAPLFLRGTGGRAVLCVHGFTGTPFEVRPLAEALARRGFTVAAPALAGHCGTVPELAATRWPDWLASVDQALDQLLDAAHGGPVGVAGFSLGGLLSLRLARLRPAHVAALTVMAAPLRLRAFQVAGIRVLANLPAPLRRGPLLNLPKFGGYDVVDEGMQKLNPGLAAMPIPALASLVDLAAVVRRDLPFLKMPTLVAHGQKDRTVPFDDSLELVGSLGADVIERLWLPASGHLVAIDVERATLTDAVCRFFHTHVPDVAAHRANGDTPAGDAR